MENIKLLFWVKQGQTPSPFDDFQMLGVNLKSILPMLTYTYIHNYLLAIVLVEAGPVKPHPRI